MYNQGKYNLSYHKKDFRLDVSRWTIVRRLKENRYVKYGKMMQGPSFKKIHIEKRLNFANETITYGEKGKDVLLYNGKR